MNINLKKGGVMAKIKKSKLPPLESRNIMNSSLGGRKALTKQVTPAFSKISR
jgi:hypothetical protein